MPTPSNSAIKVGDLVMVVRGMPCCGISKTLGKPFIVAGIKTNTLPCCFCKKVERSIDALDSGQWVPFHQLTRIDPPAIPETTEQEIAA